VKNITIRLFALSWLAGFMLLTGCARYYDRYQFTPRPAQVEINTPDSDQASPSPSRVMASIIGVRRPDRETGDPAMVEVKLRLENQGTLPISLNQSSFSLISGDLQTFLSPRLIPPGDFQAPGHGQATVTALFPFPDGNPVNTVDLEGLNLTWTVNIDGQDVPGSVSFTRYRVRYYDDDPSFHTYWRFGYGHSYGHRFGFGFGHHSYCYY